MNEKYITNDVKMTRKMSVKTDRRTDRWTEDRRIRGAFEGDGEREKKRKSMRSVMLTEYEKNYCSQRRDKRSICAPLSDER